MPCKTWSSLNHIQLGRYAEYYAKMEFASYGFEVYTSEVDDRGIDFVCRKHGVFYEVQVKSVRNDNYTFMLAKNMDIDQPNRIVCYMRFFDGQLPNVYLIPVAAWKSGVGLLVRRNYEKPEWGINLSKKNLPLLEDYIIDKVIRSL